MKGPPLAIALVAACAATTGVHPSGAQAPDGFSEERSLLARKDVDRVAEELSGMNILRHVRLLCGDRLAGREAGSLGARVAAEHVADEFRRMGLRPGGGANGYFQSFKIRAGYRIRSELTGIDAAGRTNRLVRGGHYMPVHLPADSASFQGDLVFAGFGVTAAQLDYDDYGRIDATNRAVLIFAGVPWGEETTAWLRRARRPIHGSLAYKARKAAARGARLLLVVDDPADWRDHDDIEENLSLPNRDFPLASPVPVVHLTREAAGFLTGLSLERLAGMARAIREQRRPQAFDLPAVRLNFAASISGSAAIGRNVIGVLPGSDRDLRREAIVLGAHYDHLGDRPAGIYRGANDNAAGVGAMIEIARAFTRLDAGPRRTVIFIAFGAEEIGRMGSLVYVDRPFLPMRDTILMTNFDMIGRNDPDHIFAVGTRTSRELHALHQIANEKAGLRLEHPASLRLGRSDHSSFYMANVPILYLFGGLHEGYHTVDDTPDLLSLPKLGKVARLAFLTSMIVAERRERISFGEGATPIAP